MGDEEAFRSWVADLSDDALTQARERFARLVDLERPGSIAQDVARAMVARIDRELDRRTKRQ